MATKWKYASVPAQMRLEMLRDGNKELFDEEIERTKDAVKNRLDAGLDVGEQMKWADSVSYNYNLSNAKNMGISPDDVAKTGYAEKLFGDLAVSDANEKSTPDEPERLKTEPYNKDGAYSDMDRDELYKSVAKSYIKGINDRAGMLSAQYGEYIKDLKAQNEKDKKKAYDAYNKSLREGTESLANRGLSANGGKSVTEKLKLKEELQNTLSLLDEQRDKLSADAYAKLKEQLYGLSEAAMQGIADEYYRYNKLKSDEENAEYEKLRDAAEDDKWLREFNRKGEELEYEKAYKSALLALEKDQSEAENALARDKFELDRENSAEENRLSREKFEYGKELDKTDYEKWLKEFEAAQKQNAEENALRRLDISASAENDREKNALAREQYEYKKQQDAKAEEKENAGKTSGSSGDYYTYGAKYEAYLAIAKRTANEVEYNEELDSYVKKYSKKYLASWVDDFDLSSKEKKSIKKAIDVD